MVDTSRFTPSWKPVLQQSGGTGWMLASRFWRQLSQQLPSHEKEAQPLIVVVMLMAAGETMPCAMEARNFKWIIREHTLTAVHLYW